MARNSEKAQSMLFRFRAQQAASLGILDISRTRRPKAITSITAIPTCEKWRGQVLKEISRKVSKIQEASLSDFQIRDLNDEINKLMREKHMWEVQIRGLGGPNYMRGGGRVVDEEGKEIEGAGKGYRYFGRARTLPGVAELFASKPPPSSTTSTPHPSTLRKTVDASYYGYNQDEQDGSLLAYEAQREEQARAALLRDADADADMDVDGDGDGDAGGGGGVGGGGKGGNMGKAKGKGKGKGGEVGWEPLPGDAGDGVGWALPSVGEVGAELVERRRRRLLESLG